MLKETRKNKNKTKTSKKPERTMPEKEKRKQDVYYLIGMEGVTIQTQVKSSLSDSNFKGIVNILRMEPLFPDFLARWFQ